MPTAAYDEIADWCETESLAAPADGDPLGIHRALATLLGPGTGRCLEIGCGTGVYATPIRDLGWTPVGVDLSAGMLRHARGRLPAARADAARLPIRDGSLDQGLLDRQRGPGQGRRDPSAVAGAAARVPGRRADAGSLRRGRRAHPDHAGRPRPADGQPVGNASGSTWVVEALPPATGVMVISHVSITGYARNRNVSSNLLNVQSFRKPLRSGFQSVPAA